MKQALLQLLGSKKLWTAILGMMFTAGASMLAKYGLEVTDATVQQIAITISGFFVVLLGAQGATDFGKQKAVEERQTAVTVAAIASGSTNAEANAAGERSAQPLPAPPPPQVTP